MRLAAKTIATFFGIGFAPLAPGTAASAAVVVLYQAFLHRWPLPLLVGLLVAVVALGIWAAGRTAAILGRPDPRTIVVDEVAGQLAALVLCPADWIPVLIGFGLFRFFDIVKPFPIRLCERLPGGWGIMADDLAAGAAAFLLLRLYLILI
ncbi:MAG: phosphatidylglycerophosphatase A [Candidatus Aminicenantes bacterium]|nr:phosphatidylglycerophosphatase A [Candidatus Aminicenantes bacterium]